MAANVHDAEGEDKMDITKIQSTEMAMRPTTASAPMRVKQAADDEASETVADNENTESRDISFDKAANVFVIKWTDAESKEVVMQVPAEQMLEFAKSINKLRGNVVDTKV